MWHKLARRFIKKNLPQIKFHYSQFGEDAIVSHLFDQLGVTKPSYLDVGANEPKIINNTFHFYERGGRGVLIEPNPYLFAKLQKERPKDIALNTGIGLTKISQADFYIFPNYANGLNTFSKTEALHWQEIGMKGLGKVPLDKVIKMPLTPINTILEKYFNGKPPNFISIDVEGLDLEILQSIDFDKYAPEVICVETLDYDADQKGSKNQDIIQLMLTKQYLMYADTWVNTIFCRKDILK